MSPAPGLPQARALEKLSTGIENRRPQARLASTKRSVATLSSIKHRFLNTCCLPDASQVPWSPQAVPDASQMHPRYLPLAGIFDMIGVEIQDFQELKPKPETSEQDLDDGRG